MTSTQAEHVVGLALTVGVVVGFVLLVAAAALWDWIKR